MIGRNGLLSLNLLGKIIISKMFSCHKVISKSFDSMLKLTFVLHSHHVITKLEAKGCGKINADFFCSSKTFFLLTKSFGCQEISFRYRIKENFEP